MAIGGTSIEHCRKLDIDGIEAICANAFAPVISGDEQVVCFNLILHHLIGDDEASTRSLQKAALATWIGKAKYVFVNEYVYDSLVGNSSGRLIYEITRNRFLSTLASLVSKVVPSLKANTFGVGVRFRSHDEWIRLFEESGFTVVAKARGEIERTSLPLRLLLIDEVRRDSFLLAYDRPAGARDRPG